MTVYVLAGYCPDFSNITPLHYPALMLNAYTKLTRVLCMCKYEEHREQNMSSTLTSRRPMQRVPI